MVIVTLRSSRVETIPVVSRRLSRCFENSGMLISDDVHEHMKDAKENAYMQEANEVQGSGEEPI